MRRVLPLVLLIVAGCRSPHQTTDHSAPVPGAILSVDTSGAGAETPSMTDVQAMLQAHPAWAAQALSHGLEPPHGYFVKVKGRCGSLSPAGIEIGHMLAEIARGLIRCQDVAG